MIAVLRLDGERYEVDARRAFYGDRLATGGTSGHIRVMRYHVEIVESLGPEWVEGMSAYFLPGEFLSIEAADVAGVGHLMGLNRGPGALFYRVSEATHADPLAHIGCA